MDRVIEGTVWEKIKKWSKGVDSVVSTKKKKPYKITTTEHNLSPVLFLVNVALTLDM